MTAEETAKRIKKSQTDGERMITFDPEARPGVSGLLSTAAICTGRSEIEIADEIGMGGSGTLKKYVTESVNEYFAPIRARRFLCRGREGGGRCLLEDDGDIPAGLLGPLQVRPPHTWPPRGA